MKGWGVLTPFLTLNDHDDKIYNTVVPPKILLHKKNTKGLKVFFYGYPMSQQDKTQATS